MSLARLALRLLTVKALTGRTQAGAMVRDSEIGVIDERGKDEKHPFIAVYVDEGSAEGEKLDLFPAEGTVALIIEIGVTARMGNEEGKELPGWGLPVTDAGMELMLDLIERQIRSALADPTEAWAILWNKLAPRLKAIKVIRGASDKDGVRFAGRQLSLTLSLLADPEFGAEPSGVWAEILAAFAADEELAGIADAISEVLAGTLPASWLVTQAQLAVSPNGVRVLGEGPLFETTEDPAPTAAVAVIVGDAGSDRIEASDAEPSSG